VKLEKVMEMDGISVYSLNFNNSEESMSADMYFRVDEVSIETFSPSGLVRVWVTKRNPSQFWGESFDSLSEALEYVKTLKLD